MNNKTKNIALVTGFVVMLFIAYQLSFSKTIQIKDQYNTLKEETLLFKNAPKQLTLLKQKEKHFDSILNKYQLNGLSLQNNLLKTITGLAQEHQLKVVRFNEPHRISNKDLIVNNYQFSLQGDYNGILKLVYELEQNTKFGEIINFHFEKKKNLRTNKDYIIVIVILRSFG